MYTKEQYEKVVEANKILMAKCGKVANWFESSAERNDKQAETCRFESLNKAYRADAKNYRATAADIRKAMKEATI